MTGQRRPCDNLPCPSEAIPAGRWCHECTRVVWKTGRPPELAVPAFRPAWLRNLTAKDMTGAPR